MYIIKLTVKNCNFSPTEVGVIVRLNRDSFQVLTMLNTLVELKPQALQIRRQNFRPQALDSEQNSICSKDIVKIIDGPKAVSIMLRGGSCI
jgi:transcription elongation factor SPT5